MKKITINEVEFCDFGSNNYSCGMHLITAYPCTPEMIQDVLNGKYPGVYLNPSAPCEEEFYGVFGTEEQYKEFYKRQKDACIAAAMVERFGYGNWPKTIADAYEADLIRNYKDWWEKD